MRKKICDYCGKEITKKEIMTAVLKIEEKEIYYYHWQCYLKKIKKEEVKNEKIRRF